MRYGDDKNVKLYYTISEVVDLTAIPAHILRYWEQEFPMLKPRKNRAGNRTYRQRDIELIQKIKQLVQEEQFTLQGALKRLKETSNNESESQEIVEPIQQEVPQIARHNAEELSTQFGSQNQSQVAPQESIQEEPFVAPQTAFEAVYALNNSTTPQEIPKEVVTEESKVAPIEQPKDQIKEEEQIRPAEQRKTQILTQLQEIRNLLK